MSKAPITAQIEALEHVLGLGERLTDGDRACLSASIATLHFISRPHIMAAIAEAHQLERVKKNIEEHFPGAEIIEREPE